MTSTQVRYWDLQESKRHNLASERLTASQIKESQRHNLVTEQQGWTGLKLEGLKLKETHRHNVETERLTASDIAEKQRHNIVSENLTASQIAESIRHNQAQEAETHRSNVARETETHRENVYQDKMAYVSKMIDYGKLQNELRKIGVEADRNEIQYQYNRFLAGMQLTEFTYQALQDLTERVINSFTGGITGKDLVNFAGRVIKRR